MKINGLNIPEEKLSALCQKYLVKELSIFGSILRDDFKSESDIDLLITFNEKANYSLFDIVRIQEEFAKLFGRPVDIVSRRAVERSRNFYRKKAILDTAKIIYAT